MTGIRPMYSDMVFNEESQNYECGWSVAKLENRGEKFVRLNTSLWTSFYLSVLTD